MRLAIPKGCATGYIDLKTQTVHNSKLKYQVLIIHGAIASGKTQRGEQLANSARTKGYSVHGILSKRVNENRDTIGYDMVDLQSGESQPMVYKDQTGEGWEPLRGPFSFKTSAFVDANKLLRDAAYQMTPKTLVIADEFGHLEARGFGVYPGLSKVVESLGEGKMLILCRTDKIDDVLKLFNQNETRILVMEAVQKDFMDTLADSFI